MSFRAVQWARQQVQPTQGKMLVLLDLAMYHDERRGAWPGVKTIASNTNMTDGSVRRAIAWLRDSGYLVSQQRGRGRSAVYRLNLDFFDSASAPNARVSDDETDPKHARIVQENRAPYALADEPTLLVKEEQVINNNSADAAKTVARIQRDWWTFVVEQTGRKPQIATTDRGSVMAFKTVITPFVEQGVDVIELKHAIRSMWERGRSLSVQSLDAELGQRGLRSRSDSTARLAAVKFDNEGNVVA